jgi:predicted nucleotidyltransferase
MIPEKAGPQEHLTSLDWLLGEKSNDIKQIAAQQGAYNMRVFSSVAWGEADPDSDIDFLIDTGPATSSWFPAGLILDLEDYN